MLMSKNRFIIIIIFSLLSFTSSYAQIPDRERLQDRERNQRDTEQEIRFDHERTDQSMMSPLNTFFIQYEAIDPDLYIVGPGDLFGINVITMQPFYETLPVNPDGSILIPAVGSVSVNGLTLNDAISDIVQSVKNRYPGAETYVTLQQVRLMKVLMSGAVQKTGTFIATPASKLSDILQQNIPKQLALLDNVEIRHKNGDRTIIDYYKFSTTGQSEYNPNIQEGDHIHIPYGNIFQNSIVIRGAVQQSGYITIRDDENLRMLSERVIQLGPNADMNNVTVTRTIDDRRETIFVKPENFHEFILEPGDEIQFLGERAVNVHGYVAAPGTFNFVPGYTAGDYVSEAGGLLPIGTMNRIKVTRLNGTVIRGEDTVIERGDVIEVTKSVQGTLIGDVSVMQILVSVGTIVLAVIAARR
jgi:protein involved in polysaccharide export with SLBB domain